MICKSACRFTPSAFDARQPFVMQYRLRRNDGEYRWLSDQGVPRYDAQGRFAGYIGSCVDITELMNKGRGVETKSRSDAIWRRKRLISEFGRWHLATNEIWMSTTRGERCGFAVDSGKVTFDTDFHVSSSPRGSALRDSAADHR